MRLGRWACVLVSLAAADAATLERMSLQDLTTESTLIVQGRVAGSKTVQHGALLYTLYGVEVLDQWKGSPLRQVDVALPGGRLGDFTQRFGGVPRLDPGSELVLFLWTGPSGRTQITGLTQGLFEVERAASGEVSVHRKPSAELVLDPGGARSASSTALRMPLEELVRLIRGALEAGGQTGP